MAGIGVLPVPALCESGERQRAGEADGSGRRPSTSSNITPPPHDQGPARDGGGDDLPGTGEAWRKARSWAIFQNGRLLISVPEQTIRSPHGPGQLSEVGGGRRGDQKTGSQQATPKLEDLGITKTISG